MAGKRGAVRYTQEIANLLADLLPTPSREQVLAFHPSKTVQQRARKLLDKMRANVLTDEEQWELDQFEHAEMLVQLVKATLRGAQKASP